VKSSDIIETKVSNGILYTTRLFLKEGKLPSWGRSLIPISEAFIIEFSEVDPINKTMKTVTRNLSHKKVMLVEETQIYTQDPLDQNRTLIKTEARIVSNTGWFIGSRIEGFGLYRFKKNLINSSKGILHVLGLSKDEESASR
jgi:4-amino-4-deoxychorismate lyase